MRYLPHYLLALLYAIILFSCDREDTYEIMDTPTDDPPVEIEFQEGFAFQAASGDVILTEGSARRYNGQGDLYLMAINSGEIICTGGDSYAVNGSGELVFSIDYVSVDGAVSPIRGDIATEVNGQTEVLFSFVPTGSGCDWEPPQLTITEITEETVTGTYTAGFYKFGEVIDDTLPCGGFVYVGEFTAEFSVPYFYCQ